MEDVVSADRPVISVTAHVRHVVAIASEQRCIQVAASGRRCGFDVVGDTDYCRHHQPARNLQDSKPAVSVRRKTTADPVQNKHAGTAISRLVLAVAYLTIIFFPVALVILWRSKIVSKSTKVVGSIVVVIVALFIITNINRTIINAFKMGSSPSAATASIGNYNNCIIGSTKSQVISMFRGWERMYTYEARVDSHAIKFEKDHLMAVVDFTPSGIAEGVAFLSFGLSDYSAKNSPTHRRYDELVEWATCGKDYEIYVPTVTAYPAEIYIGDVHE